MLWDISKTWHWTKRSSVGHWFWVQGLLPPCQCGVDVEGKLPIDMRVPFEHYSNKDWFSCQNLLYKILGFGLPRFFHTFWSSKIATVDLQRFLDCFPTEFRLIWDVQLPRYIMLHHVTTFDYTFGSPLGYWAKRIGNQSHGLYWHRESYLLKLPVTRIYQNWCVVSNLQFSTQVGW